MPAEKKWEESFQPNRYTLRENFERIPQLNADIANAIVNKDFEILGQNGIDSNVQFSVDGGLKVITAPASGSQLIVLPHLDVYQTAWTVTSWGTENSCRYETTIKTGASITSATIWAGLKESNVSVVATDNNQIMFRYSDAGSAYWTVVSSRAGTDSVLTTGVAVAASTSYRLAIEVDADRKVHAYINGVQVTNAGPLAALTVDIDLIPYIGIQTDAVGSKTMDIRYLECSRLM
jgi:hypothetical protein